MRSNWSDPEIESALIATLRPNQIPIGAVDRMLASLPTHVPAVPFWRGRPVRYALGVAAAAVLVVLATSPAARDAVANTVQEIFYFLPGQGIRGATPGSLVLAHPASLTRQGITLRVISVLADTHGTVLAYTVTSLPGGKDEQVGSPNDAPQPYLVDRTGHRYVIRSQSFGEGGSAIENHVAGNLGFEPLAPGVRDVDLVMESPALAIPTGLASQLERWVLPLHLVTPAEANLTPANLTAGAITVHGITLHVDQVDRTGSGLIVHLSGTGDRSSQVDYLDLAPPLGSDNYLSGSGRPGEWDLSLPATATSVSVNRVHDTEPGSTTVTINVPAQGSFALKLPVTLGRYQVVLDREEWVNDPNGHELRIYFRSGPAVDAGRVESWELDGVNSYGFVWVDTNGSDGYLELPNPQSGHTLLHMKNPHVVIEGPWILALNAN